MDVTMLNWTLGRTSTRQAANERGEKKSYGKDII